MGQFRVLLCLLALCCGPLLSACGGGSGSSGFDLKAQEEAAIVTALAAGRCVALDAAGQQVCPLGSHTPANAANGDAVLTVPFGVALRCGASTTACELRLLLQVGASQSEEPLVGIIAIRASGESEEWRVLSSARMLVPGQLAEFVLEVPEADIDARAESPVPAQVAVLLFAGQAPSLPPVVPTLSETGARTIFVSGPIVIGR